MDTHEVAALFHIHEKAIGHPGLKAISDWAMSKLKEENDTLVKGATPEPEPATVSDEPEPDELDQNKPADANEPTLVDRRL